MKTSTSLLKRRRIRAKISGTASRPRLFVNISNLHVRTQLIDDTTGKILASVTTESQKDVANKSMTQKAEWAAEQIAALAQKSKIKNVVFDRGTHMYHGRVKAFAETARKAGLEF